MIGHLLEESVTKNWLKLCGVPISILRDIPDKLSRDLSHADSRTTFSRLLGHKVAHGRSQGLKLVGWCKVLGGNTGIWDIIRRMIQLSFYLIMDVFPLCMSFMHRHLNLQLGCRLYFCSCRGY